MGHAGTEFHSVCSLTGTTRYCLLLPLQRAFNSQLWGELPQTVAQKGLQPVTLSLYAFSIRVLSPSLLFEHVFHRNILWQIWGEKSRVFTDFLTIVNLQA